MPTCHQGIAFIIWMHRLSLYIQMSSKVRRLPIHQTSIGTPYFLEMRLLYYEMQAKAPLLRLPARKAAKSARSAAYPPPCVRPGSPPGLDSFSGGAIRLSQSPTGPQGHKSRAPSLRMDARKERGRVPRFHAIGNEPTAFMASSRPPYAEALFSIISRAWASEASLASPESMRATSHTRCCPESSKSSVSGREPSLEVFFTI